MEHPRSATAAQQTVVQALGQHLLASIAATLALSAAAMLVAPHPAHSAPRGRTTPPAASKASSRDASGERYTLEGTQVAIYNLAGVATLVAASGTQTTVEVSRGGADAGELKIATGHAEGRANLRVVYPGSHIIYPEMGRGSNSSTRVRDDGTFGGKDVGGWLVGHTVRISGSGSGTEAHADLKLGIPRGTDVLLRLAVGDVHVTNVDGKLAIDTGSGSVASTGTHGVLDIDTGSGSVRVADAQGPVSIDTGSGTVDVQQLSGSAVLIDTGSGSVTASHLKVGRLAIDTGSGGVDLVDINSKRVHIDTGSGGVSISLRSIVDELSIDSGSGQIEVEVPRDTGAMLSLETGSGGIDADIPITHLRRDHGELHGQMGDGQGRIVIETGSGGIRIAAR